jgi:hypothetical protein
MAITLPQRSLQLDLPGGSPNMSQEGFIARGRALAGIGEALGGLGSSLQAETARRQAADTKAIEFANDANYLLPYQTAVAQTQQEAALLAGPGGENMHDLGIQSMDDRPETIALNNRIAELERTHPELAADLRAKTNRTFADMSIKLRGNEFEAGKLAETNHIKTRGEATLSSMSQDIRLNDQYLQEFIQLVDAAPHLTPEEKSSTVELAVKSARAREAQIITANNPDLAASSLSVPTGPKPIAIAPNVDAEFGKQLAFSQHELTGTEKAAGDRLRAATSIEGAVDAGLAYERPNAKYAHREKRIAYARSVLAGKASPKAMQARAYYESIGYTPQQASGFTGSLMQESGPNLDTSAHGDKSIAGSMVNGVLVPSGSRGIGQWNRERLAAYQQFSGSGVVPAGVVQGIETEQGPGDPRYAMLDLAQRQSIYSDALTGQQQFLTANVKAKKTADDAVIGSMNLQISQGTLTSPEQVMQLGTTAGLSDGDLATLLDSVNSKNKGSMAYANGLMARGATGDALNTGDKDVREGANAAYDKVQGRGDYADGAEGSRTLQQYVVDNGWVPSPVVQDLNAEISTLDFSARGMKDGKVNTSSLERKLSVLNQIAGTAGDLRDHPDAKAATDLLVAARRYREQGYTQSAQMAIDDLVREKDPVQQKALETMKATTSYKDQMKKVSEGTTFKWNFDLNGYDSNDVSFENNTYSKGLWNDMFTASYNKHLDEGRAIKDANMQFASVHSAVGLDHNGLTQVMTWPPDKFAPALPDMKFDRGVLGYLADANPEPLNHNWVLYQAQVAAESMLADMPEHERKKYSDTMPILVVGANTESTAMNWKAVVEKNRLNPNDPNNGVLLPIYQLDLISDEGVRYTLPRAFRPDAVAAAKDIERLRIERKQQRRVEDGQNRAPHLRDFGGKVRTRPLEEVK